LKVGIGRPPRGMDPAAYVLDSLGPSEEAPFDEVISLAAECLAVLLREGLETAMNRYQKRLTLPSQSP
jgi:peptidyl-tRNA hydrolase, PTH1 family